MGVTLALSGEYDRFMLVTAAMRPAAAMFFFQTLVSIYDE